VLDSGIYAAHPDLAARLVPGWNFVKGNADTSDILGHGTEVAGMVGASTNNGIGIAGVSWAGMVMPLVVVDKNNFAAYSDIAAAIQFAADRKARIINVSAGGSASSSALQSAVDYAWNHGSMVFAAAMNNASSTPSYPAACAHAVAVSATDELDRPATFSSFGSWVTLSAPGTDILTTMSGGGYGYRNGTSFSAPIAAGVATLVMAANPQLTNEEVLAILKESADPPPGGGFDPQFGWGRVNAWKAVELAAPSPFPAPLPGRAGPLSPDGPRHRVRRR
jgi:subtilisin family serine protease